MSEGDNLAASGVEGGCRCGAIRYRAAGEPLHKALCHCADCRASAGAPIVGWTAFPADSVTVVSGEPKAFRGKGASVRHFCGICGTGLLFTNEEMLPGIVDVQTATLDDPERFAPEVHVQVAERLGWMNRLGELPEFDRYPGS